MHTLVEKMFVFNKNKSVPVIKDQFKPYYSCHFLTRVYLYALGTSIPLFM